MGGIDARTRWRLAGMMALIYAIQGAFWPLLAVHLRDLGIDGRGRGWIFATLALGSFAMPLGAGQLVDRLMPAQRFLALAYLMGAAILAALAVGVSVTPWPLFAWFLAYWLVMAPTTVIGATLAFRNLAKPQNEFAGVRLWGTIGWMVAGWFVSVLMSSVGSSSAGQGAYEAFWVAAGLSLVLAVYSLTLPHTPPLAVGARTTSGLRAAVAMLRRREIEVYLRTAFCVCLTTPFIYQVLPTHLESRGLPRAWISTAMTLGQVPEIAALAVLPGMFRRFQFQGTLAIGIAALAVRFLSLVVDPPLWVILAGIPLQGIGVACFTIGGQVFMDSRAPAERRAGAQALLTVLTAGIGSLLGSVLAGEISTWFSRDSALVFLIPCVIDGALLVYFCASFRPDSATTPRIDVGDEARPLGTDGVRGSVALTGNLVTESADG
ncbi:Nucleoside H+ symporter [Singulisphaera sp. GP187]|uniref:MFS transporter n=1 Tax=Singulisphaera sp. GP187 TaxID=1882752 RepID=UPI00092AE049|nr:MFS transporter [Singulisphaera sp. GP187]SIO58614.1 Nucleoside H+ symporter [Singulisphaera sp. GP187]